MALLAGTRWVQAEDRFVTWELESKFLPGKRTVRICLPRDYVSQPDRRYPVLYAHDGQNVYSAAGTNVGFGWGNWELDITADRLARAGSMREVLIVAVDNSGMSRYAEYSARHRPPGATNSTAFENYSSFLIEELMPKIDRSYRTLRGATNTAVLGSSMGGLCSLALVWEHPTIFGGAASLSGAFSVEQTNFLSEVVRKYDGPAKPVRIYLDSGSVDFTGGDDGRSLTAAMAAELKRIGWGSGLEWYVDATPMSTEGLERSGLRRDKWADAQRNQHNEFYWRLRVHRALTFLFPP